MSGSISRLNLVASHLKGNDDKTPVWYNYLDPTIFLVKSATIAPWYTAIHHQRTDGIVYQRTYKQFANYARGLAYYLKSKNLGRIGILCPNTPCFLVSLFAISAAGGVSVGVNFRLKPTDVKYIFEHSEVDCIIVDSEYVKLLNEFRSAHPNVWIIEDADCGDVYSNNEEPNQQKIGSRGSVDVRECVWTGWKIDEENGCQGWSGLCVMNKDERDLFALAYTSGTTSQPKGVEYTYRGVYLAALSNIIESSLNSHDTLCRFLWILPMFHAAGWTFPWAVTAVRGTHYCLRRVNYSDIWKLLIEEKITHFNAAPTVNTLLCEAKEAKRLPNKVIVTVAASPPSRELFKKMNQLNLEPIHTYGLTETYGPLMKAYNTFKFKKPSNPDEVYSLMTRQGFAMINSLPARVITVNDDEKGTLPESNTVQVNQDGRHIGEIVLQGNLCARGYYKDESATEKLFYNGVMHSGDLAVWHADGSVQIVDRQKDIIISGGENISSVAVESILATHYAILEVSVIGVPSEKWGEHPKAFVTLRQPYSTKSSNSKFKITAQDILNWCKTNHLLSGFMRPREIQIVNILPKTATGKVVKTTLRKWSARDQTRVLPDTNSTSLMGDKQRAGSMLVDYCHDSSYAIDKS